MQRGDPSVVTVDIRVDEGVAVADLEMACTRSIGGIHLRACASFAVDDAQARPPGS